MYFPKVLKCLGWKTKTNFWLELKCFRFVYHYDEVYLRKQRQYFTSLLFSLEPNQRTLVSAITF
jgi:hypothetical protein